MTYFSWKTHSRVVLGGIKIKLELNKQITLSTIIQSTLKYILSYISNSKLNGYSWRTR